MVIVSFTSLVKSFKLKDQRVLSDWIEKTILAHHKYPVSVSYIFCDDEYLRSINKKYLNHSTLTDIITFNYNESFHVSGDIFISVERVKDNSLSYGTSFEGELHRVMVHGVLHLLGFNDKTPRDKKKMTTKENEFLAQLKV